MRHILLALFLLVVPLFDFYNWIGLDVFFSSHALNQCLFKSVFPVDTYRKSSQVFSSVTGVLAAHNGGGFSSATLPTDKATLHNYGPTYDVLMKPYHNDAAASKPVRILEVGVKKGGSLKLWREYFPPSASVFGIDVDPTITSFPRDIGIKTAIADSTDSAEMESVLAVQTFDIIVDDGCHRLRCIKATFQNLWPRLRSEGIYIVEDFPKYYKRKAKKWHPENIFRDAANNSRVCYRADTKDEMLAVVYPEMSRAPVVPFCSPANQSG